MNERHLRDQVSFLYGKGHVKFTSRYSGEIENQVENFDLVKKRNISFKTSLEIPDCHTFSTHEGV